MYALLRVSEGGNAEGKVGRVDLEVSVWGHVVRSLRDGVYGGGEGCV